MWKEAFMMLGKNASLSYRQMTFYSITWLQGSSYKKLITDYLNYNSSNRVPIEKRINANSDEEINKAINRVINVHHVVITYIVVKYTKLLKDIIEFIAADFIDKEKFKMTFSLPTMLELGTSNFTELILISNGLPRTIALKLSKLIPIEYKENPIDWLRNQTTINIKRIYLKYLKKNGFLKNDKL